MGQWRPWPHQCHGKAKEVHIVSKGGSGVETQSSIKVEMRWLREIEGISFDQCFACFLLAEYGRNGETAEKEMEGLLRGDWGEAQ